MYSRVVPGLGTPPAGCPEYTPPAGCPEYTPPAGVIPLKDQPAGVIPLKDQPAGRPVIHHPREDQLFTTRGRRIPIKDHPRKEDSY